MWPEDRDQRCIWMTAGLISYRLCDRDFDCQSCLFDAAMRGEAGAETLRRLGRDALKPPPWRFPDDRRYAPGHSWAQATSDGRVRVGVDAFAASVLGALRGVTAAEPGTRLRAGESLCGLQARFGEIRLRAAVGGHVARVNPLLERDPGRVVSSPYELGWVLELTPDGGDAARVVAALLPAETMRKRALMDLRHLRRRLGMQLLEMGGQLGATLPDGGVRLTDVSAMVGASRYLELIADALQAI